MTDNAKGFDVEMITGDTPRVTYNVDVIFNADGDAESGLITVGKDSPEYQSALEIIRIEGIQRAGKRATKIDTSTEAGATQLARIVAANEETLALAVVVGWYGFTKGGQSLAFDKSIVELAFKKFPTWREKVAAKLESGSNFTQG